MGNVYGRPRFFSPDWELNAGPDGIEGTADDGTASLFGNTTLFTGRELDAETGLLDYRARYFSAELGRFLSRDPLGFSAGDWNLYRYTFSNPITGLDPSGLEPVRLRMRSTEYWDARNAELNASRWNIINPFSKSFFATYCLGAAYYAITDAPVAVSSGFSAARNNVELRYLRGADTFQRRAAYRAELATYYAAEMFAHLGVRVGQAGAVAYAAAHGGPVVPLVFESLPAQAGLAGWAAYGTVDSAKEIASDVSRGCVPRPAAVVDCGLLGSATWAGYRGLCTCCQSIAPNAPRGSLKPPGWNDRWTWEPPSGEATGSWRWWDPLGGEWRWHAADRWHPQGHWDYNPWTRWNSRWQNIPSSDGSP